MASVQQVTAALAAFGARSGQPLSDWEMDIYLDELAPLGWTSVLEALKKIYVTQKGRAMPTVADIKHNLGASPLSDEIEAQDVASRVLSAVGKYGDTRMQGEYRARAFVGEMGWLVAERMFGSWPALCEAYTYDNHGQVFAQMRDLAETLLAKAKRGDLDRPTALPEGPSKVKQMIAGAVAALPEVKGWGKS